MSEKEAYIGSLLERLEELIVDTEDYSLHDADMTTIYEMLVNIYEETKILLDD